MMKNLSTSDEYLNLVNAVKKLTFVTQTKLNSVDPLKCRCVLKTNLRYSYQVLKLLTTRFVYQQLTSVKSLYKKIASLSSPRTVHLIFDRLNKR